MLITSQLPSSSSRPGSWLPRPQQEQFVMFCSSSLESISRGSDLRMSSQDGKGRKEEGPELLANQPACLLAWNTGVHMDSPCLGGEKSAVFSPVILIAAGFCHFGDPRFPPNEGRISRSSSLALGSLSLSRATQPLPLSSVSLVGLGTQVSFFSSRLHTCWCWGVI